MKNSIINHCETERSDFNITHTHWSVASYEKLLFKKNFRGIWVVGAIDPSGEVKVRIEGVVVPGLKTAPDHVSGLDCGYWVIHSNGITYVGDGTVQFEANLMFPTESMLVVPEGVILKSNPREITPIPEGYLNMTSISFRHNVILAYNDAEDGIIIQPTTGLRVKITQAEVDAILTEQPGKPRQKLAERLVQPLPILESDVQYNNTIYLEDDICYPFTLETGTLLAFTSGAVFEIGEFARVRPEVTDGEVVIVVTPYMAKELSVPPELVDKVKLTMPR